MDEPQTLPLLGGLSATELLERITTELGVETSTEELPEGGDPSDARGLHFVELITKCDDPKVADQVVEMAVSRVGRGWDGRVVHVGPTPEAGPEFIESNERGQLIWDDPDGYRHFFVRVDLAPAA